MVYATTTINPYIYAGINENYKNGFKLMLRRFTHFSGTKNHVLSQLPKN